MWSPQVLEEDKTDHFPLVWKPTQCIFCLGNERKSHGGRTFEYVRPNKMVDEVERHLERLATGDPIMCPHPTCKAAGLVLPGAMAFKNSKTNIQLQQKRFLIHGLGGLGKTQVYLKFAEDHREE